VTAAIPQRILLDSGTHSELIQSAAVPLNSNKSDDNALYGFNIDEANALRSRADELGLLGTKVLIYPGADEVGLTMLAKMSVDTISEAAGQVKGSVVPFDVVFRKPDNTNEINNTLTYYRPTILQCSS
jgi:hypothetical protein